jgi:hypothetical protein
LTLELAELLTKDRGAAVGRFHEAIGVPERCPAYIDQPYVPSSISK